MQEDKIARARRAFTVIVAEELGVDISEPGEPILVDMTQIAWLHFCFQTPSIRISGFVYEYASEMVIQGEFPKSSLPQNSRLFKVLLTAIEPKILGEVSNIERLCVI